MIDEFLTNAIKEKLEELHVYGVSITLQTNQKISDCEDWLIIILEVKGIKREYVCHLDYILFDTNKIDISNICNLFIEAVKEKAVQEFLEGKEVSEES